MPPKCNSRNYLCKVCSKVIKYKNVIQCNHCHDYYHFRCVGISSIEEYKVAVNVWKCSSCEAIGEITDSFSGLNLVNGHERVLDALREDMDKNMRSYEGVVKMQIKRSLHELDCRYHGQFENFQSFVIDEISEIKDKLDKLTKNALNIDEKILHLNDRLTKIEDKVKFFTSLFTEDDENAE